MDKLNQFLKNTLTFLAIFIVINYIFQSCQNPQEQLTKDAGNLLFITEDIEYSRKQTVELKISNNTSEEITIPNECPSEPFNVYRLENNEWTQKTATPDISCENAAEFTILPGQESIIRYDNWNHALFGEMGRFRIEFETELGGELKTITSNEFTVIEEGLFRKLWTGLFYNPIYNGLIFLSSVVPGNSLGWAIILLTFIIRSILLLPSHKALKAQKRMQELQPRLEKIKEKYKDDQQRIAAETMALWKEAQVNPFGSCLPMLMQFPFLIALFYVVQSGLNPDQAYILYADYGINLSDIDVNFFGLDLKKINIYFLPLIIGGLQFIQMKLSIGNAAKNKKSGKKNSKQNEIAAATNTMVYVMPVMIAVFTASLPAGVGIYWGTSTLYGIVQQLFINKGGSTSTPSKKDKDEPTVKVITK